MIVSNDIENIRHKCEHKTKTHYVPIRPLTSITNIPKRFPPPPPPPPPHHSSPPNNKPTKSSLLDRREQMNQYKNSFHIRRRFHMPSMPNTASYPRSTLCSKSYIPSEIDSDSDTANKPLRELSWNNINSKIKTSVNIAPGIKFLSEKSDLDNKSFSYNQDRDMSLTRNSHVNCPVCKISFNSETSFNDHYMLSHNSNRYISVNLFQTYDYLCDNCNQSFQDADDLSDHQDLCSVTDSGKKVDTIPTNLNGKYICPVCNNKYITGNFLGEHFIIAHNSYTEFSELDTSDGGGGSGKGKGFPGYDILYHMELLKPIYKMDIDYLIDQNKECKVCAYKYHYAIKKLDFDSFCEGKTEEEKIEEAIKILGYDIEHDEDRISDLFDTDSINNQDETILEYLLEINKTRQRPVIPCITNCCNTDICKDCLRSYIEIVNLVQCPYCKKDYEESIYDYIKIVEYSDKTNNSWSKWWKKHLYVFDIN